MNNLVKLRNDLNISQSKAAIVLGVSLRTYQRYEKAKCLNKNKLNCIEIALNNEFAITEEKGLLSVEQIKMKVTPILEEYGIDLAILFGSYAKKTAKEESDVDLLVKTDIIGLAYFGLVEKLRVALHKKVDLITTRHLTTSQELLEEILKDGIKIK